jgi:hypothetical protein
MNPIPEGATVMRLLAALTLAAVFASFTTAADKGDCPKDDPATHGRIQTLVDKELSSAERIPATGNLGFPKAVTVCMFFDPTNKGYPQDLKLFVEGSIDGKVWFPEMIAGRDVQAASANGCIAVAPVSYVRVGWPPGANVPSPGPHVTAQVQVSY